MPKKVMQDVVATKKTHHVSRHVSAPEDVSSSVDHRGLRPSAPPPEPTYSPANATPAPKIAKERTEPVLHIEDSLPEVTPAEKRREERKEASPIFEKMRQKHEERASFEQEYVSGHASKGSKRKKLFATVGILLIVIGILFSDHFLHSATVNIVLKHADVTLNSQEFRANPDDPSSIPFQIMSLSEEQSADIAATGEKNVNAKASGTITISNQFGPQSQTLIKNTRFQTPDGKVYRINASVIVPGMKVVGGKNIPGTIDVSVSADVSGADYNIGLTTFTIPGFKGTPKFEKFTATSKTPMTGGLQGTVKAVSDADMQNARVKLTDSLKLKLLSQANAQLPKGMMLFPQAVFYTFTEVLENNTPSSSPNVKFTMKGTLDAVLFDSLSLSREIARTSLTVGESEQIEVTNIKDLTFTWKKNPGTVPKDTDTLSFTLSGNAHAVWLVDTELLKKKLVSVSSGDYKKILSLFPGIDRVPSFEIKPFWKSSFPATTDRIHIIVHAD